MRHRSRKARVEVPAAKQAEAETKSEEEAK